MAISTVVKTKRDGTIKIEDGTSPTPNELTVAFKAGDFNLTIPGPEEVILQSGDVGTNWVSTLGSNAEVLTFNVVLTIEGTDHGDASDHTLTLPHCVITGSLAEGDPDTVSISLTSYANFPTDIT